MQKLKFQYLEAIRGERINTFKKAVKDSRLYKYLWMEYILNPQLIKISYGYFNNPLVKDALTKAVSWYFAFRWLFKKNTEIEKLKKNNLIEIYSLKGEIYRKDIRNFLKGIVYAGLC